jgi:hypothetical protein
MTFAEELTKIPYNPRIPEATGFLPPIARATGHVMLALAVVASEVEGAERLMSDDDLLVEVNAANGHWAVITTDNETLSTTAKTHIFTYGKALDAVAKEWTTWDHDTRIRNLRDLANRLAALTVLLDRELVGLTTSDAGFNL